MDDVTVCIGTYGHHSWREMAHRAIASAETQAPVIHVHAGSLHEARNQALDQVTTEFVIHLDADDELAPGYVEAMAAGTADLRAPMVQYLGPNVTRPPYFPHVWGHERHDCTGECLPAGNWIVIGACVRTELAKAVGGWRDFEWSEDWDLWLRCYLADASIERIPGAVYKAWVRPQSRNRAPDQAFKLAVHEAIYRANFPEEISA